MSQAVSTVGESSRSRGGAAQPFPVTNRFVIGRISSGSVPKLTAAAGEGESARSGRGTIIAAVVENCRWEMGCCQIGRDRVTSRLFSFRLLGGTGCAVCGRG